MPVINWYMNITYTLTLNYNMFTENIDEAALHELEGLLTKVEEMKNQRAMLWAQLRESIHNDDITSLIVTRQMDTSVNEILEQELQKHQQLVSSVYNLIIFICWADLWVGKTIKV